MKKDYITMAVAAIALAVAISGFAVSKKSGSLAGQNNASDTLAKIRNEKQIDVCYVPYAQAVIKDPNTGELSGHAIDAIEYIAKQVGAKINYHETTWGDGATEIATGKCDVMLYYFNQIPRALNVVFTDPIVFEGNTALVRADDSRFNGIKDVMDLDKPEYTIAVATGESGDNFVTANFKNAKIERIDVEAGDIYKFLALVSTGRADAGIVSVEGANGYMANHSDVENLFAANPFSLSETGLAVKQDDVMFLNFLNNALSSMETDGTIKKLENRYNTSLVHKKFEYVAE
jgi:ABC-type amino acid transport substrate-binding protein